MLEDAGNDIEQHVPTRVNRRVGLSARELRWIVVLGCAGFWAVILYLLLA